MISVLGIGWGREQVDDGTCHIAAVVHLISAHRVVNASIGSRNVDHDAAPGHITTLD
jgi:hypothetical protein